MTIRQLKNLKFRKVGRMFYLEKEVIEGLTYNIALKTEMVSENEVKIVNVQDSYSNYISKLDFSEIPEGKKKESFKVWKNKLIKKLEVVV